MLKHFQRVGIIGAGAWGTALACNARRSGLDVIIWAKEDNIVESINSFQCNPTFLPDIKLNSGVIATTNILEAIDADAVLIATPAQFTRQVTCDLMEHWNHNVPAILCSKGIECDTLMMMNEVLSETLPNIPIAVLSGPTFAIEVAKGKPAAVTLAHKDSDLLNGLTNALSSNVFRIYQSNDIIGAEIGGTVKNVIAIACGISEGRKLGDNARAALITRGLAEIIRLGSAKGGKIETFIGLSGIGDLTLTCNAMQSRNFALGFDLGRGNNLEKLIKDRVTVAEGFFSVAAIVKLADSLHINMPICNAVNNIVNFNADISETISAILARPTREEDF